MEYEFAFSYRNDDPGDSFWQLGRPYQIAVLVGPGEEFGGVSEDTWMSEQVNIRLGSSSGESIYHPPYLPQTESRDRHGSSKDPAQR